MAEEQVAEQQQLGIASESEIEKLKADNEAMRRKNAELLKEYKTAVESAKALPEDVNSRLKELTDYKNKSEQSKLESQGKYSEAKEALEQQFRDRSAEKDKKIADLESKLRELELISPAIQALSDITVNPKLVLDNYIPRDRIEIQDGKPIIKDGYETKTIDDYAKGRLKEDAPYLLKKEAVVGSGAPVARSANGEYSSDMLKPFLRESQNMTEQQVIFKKYGRDTWQKLREIAANR